MSVPARTILKSVSLAVVTALIATSVSLGAVGAADDVSKEVDTDASSVASSKVGRQGAGQDRVRPLGVRSGSKSGAAKRSKKRNGQKAKSQRKRSGRQRVSDGGSGLANMAGSPVSNQGSTILVAGDIALCGGWSNDGATAKLIEGLGGLVMTTGDHAYPSGTYREYLDCYEPTWGAFLSRTRPVPGNHDYKTPGAAGYFRYFGQQAGPSDRGYYTFKAGTWRVYALNSNLCHQDEGCGPGSAEYRWLKRQLARQADRCVLAVSHHPRFSSGKHGNDPAVQPLLSLLYRAGAEVVVNGHGHNYERFAPARPGGTADSKYGVRQFVVGTGGIPLRGTGQVVAPNSEVFNGTAHGVLMLNLEPDSYSWRFIPVAGRTFTDSGRGRCHGRPN